MTRRARAVAGWLTFGLVLTGCASAPTAPQPAPSDSIEQAPPSPAPSSSMVHDAGHQPRMRPAGEPVVVATGLDAPWSVVPLGDGTALVSLRGAGEVVEVDGAGGSRVAGEIAGAIAGGEGGLHGLAVAPPELGAWLYAYVGTADDNRVVRMPLTGAAGSRALGESEVVLDGIPRAATHNGGRIAFGPDGFLYVATGDAGLRNAAQDAASLAGKILCLTPDGRPAPGNPFGTEVYSLGHRNVQGIAWTPDGTMWASEFGQDTFDEVNRIEAGGNYGWPVHEGSSGDGAYTDPLVSWTPSEASPSGLAADGDTLFVAGLRGERVWAVDVFDNGRRSTTEALWTGAYGRVRDVVVAGDELWMLTNNTDGRGDAAPDDDRLLRVPLRPVS